MSQIKVTAEELHRVASHLQVAAAGISGDNAHALALVNGVAREGWQGAASAQFMELFTLWKSSFEHLTDALTQISTLLDAGATTYESAEEQVRRSMS